MVTRLVACLVVGGAVVSIVLGVLEWQRSQSLLHLQLTHKVTLTVRNVQGLLHHELDSLGLARVRQSIRVVAADPCIRAVRVTGHANGTIVIGAWPENAETDAAHWLLPERGIGMDDGADWRRATIVHAPFMVDGRPMALDLYVDGASAWQHLRAQFVGEQRVQWLFLAFVMLLGLLLLRRWFTGPLSEVSQLVSSGAGAESFYNTSRQLPGEFGQLTEAIGGMLTRLDCTAQRLRQRERAFENLYQFAPAAMLSLDADGQIVEANRRAAKLLAASNEQELIGRSALEFTLPADHTLLRQTIDRLDLDNAARCDIRITARGRTLDVLLECTAVRDDDGKLRRVRLSMQDVSESRKLQRQLADKSRLLNLVIDHMSDAILLVDAGGRIVAHNQQLAALLHRRSESLNGQLYDPEHFWDELGVVDHDLFVSRLRQIDADHDRPAQERVVTRVGTFLFEGICVHDASGETVGRLWVVQEITAQEQNERLIKQQTNQLHALKRLGYELRGVRSVDELLERSASLLHEMFGVEALGLALRRDANGGRSQQVIHRGQGAYLLDAHRTLVEVIERHLLPQVMSTNAVACWPDLPPAAPWTKPFALTGLTCLACGPLRSSADIAGILWIARRGGERLDRHHIYLLEALLPMIAARVELAQLRERLRDLELTDPVTDLPNRRQFEIAVRSLSNRPGHPWAAVVISVDHFRPLNDRLGHEGANQLLRQVATSLRASVRRSCDVARFGGKVFAILCPNLEAQQAAALAERVRQVIAEISIRTADGDEIELTASVGVAGYPSDGADPDAIVALAEARVERAKQAGRNRVIAEGAAMPTVHRQAG